MSLAFEKLSKRRGGVYIPADNGLRVVEAPGVGYISSDDGDWRRVSGTGETVEAAKNDFMRAAEELFAQGRLLFRPAAGAEAKPL